MPSGISYTQKKSFTLNAIYFICTWPEEIDVSLINSNTIFTSG